MYLESLLTLLSLQYWTNCFSILEDCIRVDERNPEFVIEETDFVEKKNKEFYISTWRSMYILESIDLTNSDIEQTSVSEDRV